jgi:hypothetical protein
MARIGGSPRTNSTIRRPRRPGGSTPGAIFNLYLVETCCSRRDGREPHHRYGRLTPTACNHSVHSCVVAYLQQRMAVVGNGNIDVGNEHPTRKPGQPVVEAPGSTSRVDQQNPLRTERPRISGAMAQQCGDNGRGNQSAPQKFVRLVGCRDPKARPERTIRPRPVPR